MNKPIVKSNKTLFSKVIAILIIISCTVLYAVFAKPAIETHNWRLSIAQRSEPYAVVAHNPDYDFSDDESTLFKFSKPTDLICVAENGKLTITDKTNNNVYNGTYKLTSRSRHNGQKYHVVINGKEGSANTTGRFNRTLIMSIDGYILNFKIDK